MCGIISCGCPDEPSMTGCKHMNTLIGSNSSDALNRQEGQWAPSIKERFGIADPREVMSEVDQIIEAHSV